MLNLFKKKEIENNLFARIGELTIENDDLKTELKNYENDWLGTENKMLKDEVGKLNTLCADLSRSNDFMEDHIKIIEQANKDLTKINLQLNEKVEKFESKAEKEPDEEFFSIKVDDDYYNTKKLDAKMFSDALDKSNEEKEIYRDTINIMCDKFNISHDEVYNIIDDIQASKVKDFQKER